MHIEFQNAMEWQTRSATQSDNTCVTHNARCCRKHLISPKDMLSVVGKRCKFHAYSMPVLSTQNAEPDLLLLLQRMVPGAPYELRQVS